MRWFEQADADQPSVVTDAFDRVSVELKFAQDGGGKVNAVGAQLGKGDRLLASAAQSLEHSLVLVVCESHRPSVAGVSRLMGSAWERRSSAQRSLENVDGWVVAMKCSTMLMKRPGS